MRKLLTHYDGICRRTSRFEKKIHCISLRGGELQKRLFIQLPFSDNHGDTVILGSDLKYLDDQPVNIPYPFKKRSL
jgi:hypothetical protein